MKFQLTIEYYYGHETLDNFVIFFNVMFEDDVSKNNHSIPLHGGFRENEFPKFFRPHISS